MKRTLCLMFLALFGCASLSEARDPPRIYHLPRVYRVSPPRQPFHQASSLFVPFFDPAPLSSLLQPLPPPYSAGSS